MRPRRPVRGIPPPPPPSTFRGPITRSAHHAPRHGRRVTCRAGPGRERAPGALMRRARGRGGRVCGRATLPASLPRLPAPRRPRVASVASARPGTAGTSSSTRSTAGRPAPGRLRRRGFASARWFGAVPGRVPGAPLATAGNRSTAGKPGRARSRGAVPRAGKNIGQNVRNRSGSTIGTVSIPL